MSGFCSIIPDIDAIGFKLGVPYNSTFGHRGFTHSILFAALMGMFVAWLFAKVSKAGSDFWGKAVYFFIVTLSHPLLDACTTGGLGVAFFSPFSNHRYFFPFHPIKVSPIGVNSFFSEWGMRVLLSEFIWIGIPVIALVAITNWVRRKLK